MTDMTDMTDARSNDEATHGSGIRNPNDGVGSDRQRIDRARNDKVDDGKAGHNREPHHHHIDPAEDAMSRNPNPSPPIIPNPD